MTEQEAIKYLKITRDCAENGSVGELKRQMCDVAIEVLEEIQEYHKIGTVEECKTALEKQKPRKPLQAEKHQQKAGYKHKCPNCNCAVGYTENKRFMKRILIENAAIYCCICGQKLNWGDEDV